MKKLILLPLAALACAFTFQTSEIKPIAIGAALPKGDAKLHDVINNKDVMLNDSKGETGLLVLFSCNTCPYVIAQESRILQAQTDAKKLKIGMVIVNSNEGKRGDDDSQKAMLDYAKKQNYIMPYVVDENSAVADAFGATRTPEAFLFDKDGKLVYHGSIDDSPRDESAAKDHFLTAAMQSLADGKEIAAKTSVSTGCTIKRK